MPVNKKEIHSRQKWFPFFYDFGQVLPRFLFIIPCSSSEYSAFVIRYSLFIIRYSIPFGFIFFKRVLVFRIVYKTAVG